jgi:hypothetical protein
MGRAKGAGRLVACLRMGTPSILCVVRPHVPLPAHRDRAAFSLVASPLLLLVRRGDVRFRQCGLGNTVVAVAEENMKRTLDQLELMIGPSDSDAVIDELFELGEIVEIPNSLKLSGVDNVGITERVRRALAAR